MQTIPGSTQTAASEKATQLQFLRFLAFLQIFIWHAEAWNFFGYPAANSGNIAVSFFFCLSGLVTGYSGRSREIKLTLPEMGRYMGNKLRRLYPLYFLTMLIPVLHSDFPERIAAGDIAGLLPQLRQLSRNLLLIQSWFPTGQFTFNIVGWFLSTLLFLNLFNLPCLYAMQRIGTSKKRFWIFGGLFAGIVLGAFFYCGLTRRGNLRYWHYVFPPARLGEYLSAMLLGFVLRDAGGRFSGKHSRLLFTLAEIGALLVWWGYLHWWGFYWTTQSVHWLLPNLLLLGVFTIGKGWISQCFRWRPLVWLGDLSFECYLIHELFVIRYEVLHGSAITHPRDQAIALAYCLGMTILAAAVAHFGLARKSPKKENAL